MTITATLVVKTASYIPYSRKYWRGLKFGSQRSDRQIKIRQYFLYTNIRMAIPYRNAKFKSAIFVSAAQDQTAKTANISGYTVYTDVA